MYSLLAPWLLCILALAAPISWRSVATALICGRPAAGDGRRGADHRGGHGENGAAEKVIM